MSCHGECLVSETIRKKYKTVENFLRRCAFNLGNSPSQTEVKIISCIPIDIADLQEKIFNLEKQLDDTRNNMQRSLGHSVNYARPLVTCQNVVIEKCSNGEVVERKISPDNSPHDSLADKNVSGFKVGDPELSVTRTIQPPEKGKSSTDINQSNNNVIETATVCNCAPVGLPHEGKFKTKQKLKPSEQSLVNILFKKDFLRKRRKKGRRPLLGDNIVCYAQTATPFQLSSLYTKNECSLKVPNKRSQIGEMIQKPPDSVVYVEKTVDGLSEVSAPVCRDITCNNEKYSKDSCSCCQGNETPFAVDSYCVNYVNETRNYTQNQCLKTTKHYYDSSYYDIVPVKDSTTGRKYCGPQSESSKLVDIMCWPGETRAKIQTHRHNYNVKQKKENEPQNYFTSQNKVYKQNMQLPKNCIKNYKQTPFTSHRDDKHLQNNVRNCNTYTQYQNWANLPKTSESEKKRYYLNSSDAPVHWYRNSKSDDLTSNMLFEIKGILQTVLQEIKNKQVPGKAAENNRKKETKNVLTQKGMSKFNMPGCNYVRNVSCRPYGMSPINMNCSSSINPDTPCCYSAVPFYPMHVQNFPFIPCSSNQACPVCKDVNCTRLRDRSIQISEDDKTDKNINETEKLIADIYKSLATNLLDETRLKSTNDRGIEYCVPVKEQHTDTNSIFVNDIQTCNIDKERSEGTSKNKMISEDILTSQTYVDHNDTRTSVSLENIEKNFILTTVPSKESVGHTDPAGSSTSTKSYTESQPSTDETTLIMHGKPTNPEKTKRLSKIIRSFFTRKKKMQSTVTLETVYEKLATDMEAFEVDSLSKNKKNCGRPHTSKYETHCYSKNHCPQKDQDDSDKQSRNSTYDRENRNRSHQAPYMEQEYRRNWYEGLAFSGEPKRIYTTEDSELCKRHQRERSNNTVKEKKNNILNSITTESEQCPNNQHSQPNKTLPVRFLRRRRMHS